MAKARVAQPLPVAVVEDDSGVRSAVRNLLSSAKLPSRGFRSAESFLEASRRQRFGCLVTDVDLPGMSGVALNERLQRSGITIPTIFLTAREDMEGCIPGKAPRRVIVRVLRKPFRASELLRAVRAALRRSYRLNAAVGRRAR